VVRDAGQLRVRGPQRPDAGRQRTRGDAVPRHQHGRELRSDRSDLRAPADRELPVRRPRV